MSAVTAPWPESSDARAARSESDRAKSEDLYIDGQVEGTIDPKGSRLTIGPNGSVKANVNACAVVVQGRLEGNIHASDRVDLKRSAIVVGDIATQRISIDEGAYLKGSVNIQKEAPKKEVLGGIALSPNEAAQPRKRWPLLLF